MPILNPEIIAALVLFAFVASITPGPNNTMLMASGANFGFRATVPHMTGVALGFGVMVVAIGLGLGQVFAAWPWLHDVLALIGGLYMVWLAWKIATSHGIGGGAATTRPQTFVQAAGFQWINPKAWAMAVGAVTTYAPRENYTVNVLVVSLIFVLVNAPCITVWAGFGAGMRRYLDRPQVLRGFNLGMAMLLLASLVPLTVDLTARAQALF